MKSQEYGMEYASARATPELVGRDEILNIISKAIEEKNEQPQVIYITAWGGMGKTRLLEEVVKRWGSGSGSKSKKKAKLLIISHLIDLYHTHTHSEEGLIAEIVETLDPEGKLFPSYAKKRAELTHMKFERGETQPIQGLRREMIEAFLAELNELGKKYGKIVIAFDTAEVLTYETDRVQQALELADQPIGVARWLTQDFINRLSNTVVLIGGRPESPQLAEELRRTNVKLTEYDLPGFSEEETFQYFKVIAEAAHIENPQSAKRIESIPEETRQTIHNLTGGKPFVLALLIDYLAIAKEIPSLTQSTPESFTNELRDLIVETIQEGWRPMDRVVEALSWTPKGMGAELLAWILNNRQITGDDAKEAQEAINNLRKSEERLSFVKIRTFDDLVFLQDEMYYLMEQVHNDPSAMRQRKRVYENILAFYEWKIRQTQEKIGKMERDLQVIGEIPADKMVQVGKKSIAPEEEKLRKARARLQAYQVEQVYYTLQDDVLKGFELYSRYAEEPFQSRDPNLFLLLRDELLRFAAKYMPVEGLVMDDINADMGSRWIQFKLADDKYDQAEKMITRFRESCSDLVRPGSYADLNLKIWETWILTYTGKDHEKARELLGEISEKMEMLPSKNSLDKWRISFLKAYAMSMQGFLYRMQGEFKLAVEKYLLAVPFWRKLDLKSEAANNLNNLAWVEAEAGDFQTALAHCTDSLHLRRKLGRRYPIGLSLNTLGLIETRMGNPEKARFHCQQALNIFREMENASGIGLACLAYAEALRRMTNVADLLTHGQAVEHLKDAGKYAEEAVKIFTEQVKQPLRLVESCIEVGCVYREWVRHLPIDDSEREEKIEKSRTAFEAAMDIAEQGKYEYRAIDALVNLAWLYYYASNAKKAEDVLRDRVRDRLGDEHLFTTEHGVDESHAPTAWNWVQLGKANVLLGMIHFSQYKQANQAKRRAEAEQKLRQAAHNWTLSMAYNSLYGKDFRDFTKGREDVYECLEQLNTEELSWVVDSINRTHREYHVVEEQRAFEQFMKERFGVAL